MKIGYAKVNSTICKVEVIDNNYSDTSLEVKIIECNSNPSYVDKYFIVDKRDIEIVKDLTLNECKKLVREKQTIADRKDLNIVDVLTLIEIESIKNSIWHSYSISNIEIETLTDEMYGHYNYVHDCMELKLNLFLDSVIYNKSFNEMKKIALSLSK